MSLILGVPSGLKILLDFFGDIDLIVSRIEDPGWMQTAYLHIVSFSPGANLVIFLFSLGLFGYFMKKQPNGVVTIPANSGVAKNQDNTQGLDLKPEFIVELGNVSESPYLTQWFQKIKHRYFPNGEEIDCTIWTINICLKNNGVKSIENCQVVVNDIQPRPIELQSPTFPLCNPFTLTTQPVFLPIISNVYGKIGHDGPIRLEAINTRDIYFEERERTITVHVSGENAHGLTKRFRVWSEMAILKMEMLEG